MTDAAKKAHLAKLMQQATEYEAKKAALFGCKIVDRTPAGYGPKE